MKENKILKKKKISAKIASGQALFPPLVKAKIQHQNFEKHPKQKRCAIRCLNVQSFCYFSKKFMLTWWKTSKTVQNRWLYGNCIFVAVFFTFFTMLVWFF